MKVLGIIPARGGSTRVPGKNLRLLGGRPLLEWVLRAAIEAKRLDRIAVSSDDPEILAFAESVLPGSGLQRPAALARADSPAIDYVRHAFSSIRDEGHKEYECAAIIQPSSPFTRGCDIDSAIELLFTSGADSAVTVVRVPHDIHPVKMKRLEGLFLVPYVEEERGRLSYGDLSPVYVRNGSVYVVRREVAESGDLLGRTSVGLEMARSRSVDINDETDLMWAEFMYSRARVSEG